MEADAEVAPPPSTEICGGPAESRASTLDSTSMRECTAPCCLEVGIQYCLSSGGERVRS